MHVCMYVYAVQDKYTTYTQTQCTFTQAPRISPGGLLEAWGTAQPPREPQVQTPGSIAAQGLFSLDYLFDGEVREKIRILAHM